MSQVWSPVGGATLAVALANELVLASQLLTELAYELGGDETVLRRYMASLQKIDLVTQMQLAVSDILREERDVDEAIRAVTLDDMRARLSGAVIAPSMANRYRTSS